MNGKLQLLPSILPVKERVTILEKAIDPDQQKNIELLLLSGQRGTQVEPMTFWIRSSFAVGDSGMLCTVVSSSTSLYLLDTGNAPTVVTIKMSPGIARYHLGSKIIVC